MIPIFLVFGVVASMVYGYFFGVRAAMFFWLGHITVVIVYAAQQSMHLTSGSLRDLWASFWLRVLSALKHFTSPPTGR